MTKTVLVIGGSGRIGRSVAADVLTHTAAEVTVTGRQPLSELLTADVLPQQKYQSLNLGDRPSGGKPDAQHDLTIHCAGPFRNPDHHVF